MNVLGNCRTPRSLGEAWLTVIALSLALRNRRIEKFCSKGLKNRGAVGFKIEVPKWEMRECPPTNYGFWERRKLFPGSQQDTGQPGRKRVQVHLEFERIHSTAMNLISLTF